MDNAMPAEANRLNELALAHSRKRLALVEEACEKALQGGACGVLTYVDSEGVEHIGPHPSVPYGMIHNYPHGLPKDFS